MEFSSRMEEELKCPACRRLVVNPVVLTTCSHCLCLECASRLQMPLPMALVSTPSLLANNNLNDSGIISSCPSASRVALNNPPNRQTTGAASNNALNAKLNSITIHDADETMSILSETDSGVMCSRPESYVGTSCHSFANLSGVYSQQNHLCTHPSPPQLSSGAQAQVAITCPLCSKVTYSDDKGSHSLAKAKTLSAITAKYRETKQLSVDCQLCQEGEKKSAVKMCQQCEVFMCEDCHRSYHSTECHSMMGVEQAILKLSTTPLHCHQHPEHQACMFCAQCKVSVCVVCTDQMTPAHQGHRLQPLSVASKSHKSELSQMLHHLSEKAKSGTEFIARLKGLQETVESNHTDLEAKVYKQCDQLIEAIEKQKQKFSSVLAEERASKIQAYRDQMLHCSSRVQRSTGLIQFSIEALKETDPTSFLQISTNLLDKVSEVDTNFIREVEFEPRTTPEFEYRVETARILRSIDALELIEMKKPGCPIMLPRECTTEGNTITVVWRGAEGGGCVEGYVLEIDDGNLGNFRKVFSGKESICTVEGLHFDTPYRARVRAFNVGGEGPYSHVITLQTSRVAWFHFDATNLPTDVVITNDNHSVTCSSLEDRVVLGSVGFVRGIHFWEFLVDRYDNNKDPAFGVARYDVDKTKMLGKDDKGWSTYIDNSRSWFIHDGQHVGRTIGGMGVGSVVGVLLDLEKHNLSFFLNGQRHGPPVAFTGLSGVFYPAVSLNRHVQVTVNSGLEPPFLPLSNHPPSTPTPSSCSLFPLPSPTFLMNNSDNSIQT